VVGPHVVPWVVRWQAVVSVTGYGVPSPQVPDAVQMRGVQVLVLVPPMLQVSA
jgi:hypothetical protein